MEFTFEYYQKSADFILQKISKKPEICIVLGSSLGDYGDQVENPVVIDYKDIPNFLVSTAPSHAGKLIFGQIGGKEVVCMSGRFHTYEGYSFQQLAIPIRVMKLIGVQTTILTNAAGAINTDYRPGDIMVIKDHIKLWGSSPMAGSNIPEFGDRFFDVTKMYTPSLREIALRCGENSGLTLREGVYIFFPGPQFETPAEIRAARILGADAVGMSTVTEALTAAHCQMPVLGLSVMTNMAAGVLDQPLTTEEVNETGRIIAQRFGKYVTSIVAAI